MDLTALLKRHERKAPAFKRDLSSPANVLRSIVAFANSSGGILLLGVEDGTRELRDYPVRSIEDAAEFVRKHAWRSFHMQGVRWKS